MFDYKYLIFRNGDGCHLFPSFEYSFKLCGEKRGKVTGAAGFIGSHVAEHCHNMGMRVIAIDDLSGGFLANVLRTAEPLAEKTLSGDSQRFS